MTLSIFDNSSVFRVEKMCNILDIKRVHKESYGTYGARRIKAQLKYDRIECGKNKISKLMKENNISSKITRKYKATTYSDHNYAVTPNLLKQDFNVEAPKKAYVGDITYIGTEEGWLYSTLGYKSPKEYRKSYYNNLKEAV